MSIILFSLFAGLIISLTYNYFSLVKFKYSLLFILIDSLVLSVILYISIYLSNFFEEKSFVPLLLLFVIFVIVIVYMLMIRDQVYFKFLVKNRLEKLEYEIYKKYNKRVKIYTNDKIVGIKVFLNKKNVLISTNIEQNLTQEHICNIIIFNLNKNLLQDSLFIVLYFIPAIIFYYSASYTSGTLKTSLILFASALIFLLKKYITNSKMRLDIKSLYNKIDKNELIKSINQYYKIISIDLSSSQKSINQYKMSKSIEAINKLL